jgi:hypothetical protein
MAAYGVDAAAAALRKLLSQIVANAGFNPLEKVEDVAAAQSGSIYGWPGDHTSWDQPDSRWILGLTWLFTKVQPQAAAGVDLMDEVEAFFTELYRLTPAAVQAEVVPTLFGSLP